MLPTINKLLLVCLLEKINSHFIVSTRPSKILRHWKHIILFEPRTILEPFTQRCCYWIHITPVSSGYHLYRILVRVERFELPTLWSQTRCATRLRYTRINNLMTNRQNNDNENLRLMYALAGDKQYNPYKWSTCTTEFVPSYQKIIHKYKPQEPFKQIKVRFVFK